MSLTRPEMIAVDQKAHKLAFVKAQQHADRDFTRSLLKGFQEGILQMIDHEFDPLYVPPTVRAMEDLTEEDRQVTVEDLAELEHASKNGGLSAEAAGKLLQKLRPIVI